MNVVTFASGGIQNRVDSKSDDLMGISEGGEVEQGI
jgi:hypothetical protein